MRNFFLLSLLLVAWTPSCEVNRYTAVSQSGSVTESNYQFGGTRSAQRSDGSSYSNDFQQSARDAFSAFGLMVTGFYTYSTMKVQEATKQLAAAGATKVQITQLKTSAQLAAEKLRAQAGTTNAAIGAGATVNPITVNPP